MDTTTHDAMSELAALVVDRNDVEARIRCARLEGTLLADPVAWRRRQKLAYARSVRLLLGCRSSEVSVDHVLCVDHSRLDLDHSLVLEDVLARVVGEHF